MVSLFNRMNMPYDSNDIISKVFEEDLQNKVRYMNTIKTSITGEIA